MRNKIVLIDDNTGPREDLNSALLALTSNGDEFSIVTWLENDLNKLLGYGTSTTGESNATEDIVARALSDDEDIALIVVDHDLSAFELPITKSAIVAGCRAAMIPVCTYHRAPANQTPMTVVKHIQAQQHSYSLQVPVADSEAAATTIVSVTRGFSFLIDKIPGVLERGEASGPAEIVAEVLGRPEQATYFSSYLESATLISDILEFADDEGANQNDMIAKKLSLVLGYWLYNYVLVYPGILLNDVAASSYLDLSEESFEKAKNAFSDAKYDGPFGGEQDFWWRYNLDDILIENDTDSGFSFLVAKGDEAERSTCFRSGEAPAGYYCIAHRKPISLEESRGDISWIPSGADLCRIDNNTYEKLSALLGM